MKAKARTKVYLQAGPARERHLDAIIAYDTQSNVELFRYEYNPMLSHVAMKNAKELVKENNCTL